jgi:peptide/nickel transport system substrate-binding protein
MAATSRGSLSATVLVVLALTACAPTSAPSSDALARGSDDRAQRRTKSLIVGIAGNAEGFGLAGSGGPTGGGWATASEIHSHSLITSEPQSRKPIGLLAESVPSLDDGTITILGDGRVRVVYRLRKDVTWQDGARFSAQDLMLSYHVATDRALPFITQARQVADQFDSAEASDDYTFALTFKNPYYQAATLGLRPFWPYPRHILGETFERYRATDNADELLNLPYWTTEYVHLGPFRLSVFDPGEGLSFTAYDGYFRGRPKLDLIQFKFFANDNALFSNLLAGTTDMFLDSTLRQELESQLMDRWGASGEGTVRQVPGDGGRYVTAQFRPEIQIEAATLDPRVRGALYQGLDRDAFAEALGRPGLGAYGIRPPGDLFHEATKDAFRRYPYDPNRAKEQLQALGWAVGGDGLVRHTADGRLFRTAISSTPGADPQVAILADYWRRIGLTVEENIVSAALARNTEYLSQFPGWELSSNRADAMLTRFAAAPSSPANRWSGNNRGGFVDPLAQQLVNGFILSLSEAQQLQAMRRLSDYYATDLPVLMLVFDASAVGFRKGVIALDDLAGGAGGGTPYGLYSRNAHLWDRT